MKRFLICMLAMLMVAALVGCKASNQPAEQPEEPTQEPAVVTEAPVEPTEAPVEPTEAPVEPTEEPTEEPEEPTEEPTEEPSEPTEEPAIEGDAEEIVGTWTLTKAVVSGVEVTAEQMGTDMIFVFNADGSASLTSGESTQDGLSWAYENGVVKLTAYGIDLYDFTFDGTTLTLTEPNSGVDLIFER